MAVTEVFLMIGLLKVKETLCAQLLWQSMAAVTDTGFKRFAIYNEERQNK